MSAGKSRPAHLSVLAGGVFVLGVACGAIQGASSGDGGARGDAGSGDGNSHLEAGGGSPGSCIPFYDGGGTCEAAVPVVWAEWPMPNSPIDVEAGAPNVQSYMDNGDGTVTDRVTGLMWEKGGTKDLIWDCAGKQGSAQAYCSSLALAGHDDWRLPTTIELLSLLDFSSPDVLDGPGIDTRYFEPLSGLFWSSVQQSHTAIDTKFSLSAVMCVVFLTGLGPQQCTLHEKGVSVRCVR
jgi:hypothetical protein